MPQNNTCVLLYDALGDDNVKRWIAVCCFAGTALMAQSRTVVDNDQVKVLDVTQQPHQKTRLHEHNVNRVMIYLQPGRQDFDYQAQGKKTIEWKAGEAKWSPASGQHIAEITSDQPVRIIEVELKKPGTSNKHKNPLDPLKVDPKHYHVEFENDQVRVMRVKIGPKEMAPMHSHVLNRVVVYLTDQKNRVTSADGKVEEVTHKAGDVAFAGQAKHKEENIGDKEFEVLVVDLKS